MFIENDMESLCGFVRFLDNYFVFIKQKTTKKSIIINVMYMNVTAEINDVKREPDFSYHICSVCLCKIINVRCNIINLLKF